MLALPLLMAGLFVTFPFSSGATRVFHMGVAAAQVATFALCSRFFEHRVFSLALAYPVCAILFPYMLARSALLALARGGIYWRGTFYPISLLRRGEKEDRTRMERLQRLEGDLMQHAARSGLKDYEERWEQAGVLDEAWEGLSSVVTNLQGDWNVERLSGPLPMPFVWKRVRNGQGETYVLPPPPRLRRLPLWPRFPFRLEQREGHVALIYAGPLSFLVDELRLEADGSWLGRANAAGIRYAWFGMTPIWTPERPGQAPQPL